MTLEAGGSVSCYHALFLGLLDKAHADSFAFVFTERENVSRESAGPPGA